MRVRTPRRTSRAAVVVASLAAALGVAATPAGAGPVPPDAVLPDLFVQPPTELFVQLADDGRRQLRFETTVANVGAGAFRVVGTHDEKAGRTFVVQHLEAVGGPSVTHRVGDFEFHPDHDHWHIEAFSRAELFAYDPSGMAGESVARTEKITSCIADLRPSSHADTVVKDPQFEGCGRGAQGLSPGWLDTYRATFAGQEIDIEGVPNGRYLFRLTIDPDRRFRESLRRNNVVDVPIELTDDTVLRCPGAEGACAAVLAASEPSTNVVASGLDIPWDVAFTPDDRAFFTERDRGVVRELDDDRSHVVRRFRVDDAGEGGLLGIAASPDYSTDGLLYVYFTTDDDNRIVRFAPDDDDDPEPVLTGIPAGSVHNGGRIAFGPDGMLWVATGDAGVSERAQEPDSLGGKILRITPDGDPAPDNPDPSSPVYASGFRNVQGLTWLPDGRLLATDFGPDVDDEVNVVEAGGNYGWPVVTGAAGDDRFVDPVAIEQPPDASWSGMATVPVRHGSAWAGDVLVASLRGERLWRLTFAPDGALQARVSVLQGQLGRFRHVAVAPDGGLWVLTSNRDGRGDPAPGDDRILALRPPPAD